MPFVSIHQLHKMLKYNARLALKGRWGQAVCICLLGGLPYGLLGLLQQVALRLLVPPVSVPPGEAPALFRYAYQRSLPELVIVSSFTLLSLLLLAPLSLGVKGYFQQAAWGAAPSCASLFRFFASFRGYRRAVWMEITMTLRSLLWASLFFLPPAAVFTASYTLLLQGQGSGARGFSVVATVGFIFSIVMLILFLFLFIAYMNRYALAPYLLCSYPELPVSAAIAQSISLTKGYRFHLLWFTLSFLGWGLLSLPLLGIPLLVLLPYLHCSTAVYARFLSDSSPSQKQQSTREFVVGENPLQEL